MTDIRRVLAQACDQITDAIMRQAEQATLRQSLSTANETLVAVRENLQNLLGEIMEREKQDRE